MGKLCHRITDLNSEVLPSCAAVPNCCRLCVLSCLMIVGDGIVRIRLLTFRREYMNLLKRLQYTTTRTMDHKFESHLGFLLASVD